MYHTIYKQFVQSIQWASIKYQWFFPGTPVSPTNKTDRHDITEILLKVALNTINQTTKSIESTTQSTRNDLVYNFILKCLKWMNVKIWDIWTNLFNFIHLFQKNIVFSLYLTFHIHFIIFIKKNTCMF